MRTSAFMAGEGFARLRREIQRIEAVAGTNPASPELPPGTSKAEAARSGANALFPRPPPITRRASSLLPFAIPRLDEALGGGLRRAALHEFRSAEGRDAGALVGFAVAIVAGLAQGNARPILWITEAATARETGNLYGTGLGRFGLDPARLIMAAVRRPKDALWVFEEGLRCPGIAAVVTELHGNPRLLDLTASRRLALRAAEHNVTGLLLRSSAKAEPGAANTRWLVGPLPAATDAADPEGLGDPAWRLTLERNRQGTTGTFDVEWNHDRRCFVPAAPAHPRPVAPPPRDRPPAPPDAGKIVALPTRIHREDLPREERRRRLRARG